MPDLVSLIPSAKPDPVSEIAWLRPNFVDAEVGCVAVVQSFVIKHGGKVIVVDTCVGNKKDVSVVGAGRTSR